MADTEHKLHILARIAEGLNASGTLWCVGASALLYFNGLVEEFHDLDIMVAAADADKAERVLSALGACRPQQPTAQYGTKRFLEYCIDGVDVDMIAGFSVIADGIAYDCDLTPGQIERYAFTEGQRIPLQALGCWKRYYRLMGRKSRVELLAGTEEK